MASKTTLIVSALNVLTNIMVYFSNLKFTETKGKNCTVLTRHNILVSLWYIELDIHEYKGCRLQASVLKSPPRPLVLLPTYLVYMILLDTPLACFLSISRTEAIELLSIIFS